MVKKLIHALGRRYIGIVCENEYREQKFRPKEKVAEYSFLFRHLSRIRAIDILDVGTGTTAYAAVLRECGYVVTCVDKIQGYWAGGLINRHSHVLEDDIVRPAIGKTFDVVVCLMAVQGIPEADAAVASMFRLLNPGGSLILSFPYNETEYVQNVYKLPEAAYGKDLPYIGTIFSRRELDRWAEANRATLVDQEYWQCFTGRLWAFGERIWPPRQASADRLHQMSCVLFGKSDDA